MVINQYQPPIFTADFLPPVVDQEGLARLLGAGAIPCLYEEAVAVWDKISELGEEQRGYVEAKQTALQQSTENMGHDDGGQEAAEGMAKITARRAEAYLAVVEHGCIVERPTAGEVRIGIGSCAIIRQVLPGQRPTLYPVVLCGAADAFIDDETRAAFLPSVIDDEEVSFASYGSPVGRAVLGLVQGDETAAQFPVGHDRLVKGTVEVKHVLQAPDYRIG